MATAEDRRLNDSGIEIKPVYTADDAPPGALEPPGEFPFTRGPYPTMYRGRPWTIRQYAGYGSAEETNARFRYLLERGQTGLSVAFDLPTQLGYDSDDPLAEGEVGRTGVAIDSIADMEVLLDGIPLSEVSTSMTINAPAALLLLLYELVAEGQGVSGEKLRGTVQNDVLKEYVARGNYIFPPRPSMRLATDLFAYCEERLPSWNTISISGYHIREAGSSAAQELAFTLANGIAYCEAAIAAGLSPDQFGERALVLLQRAQRLLPGGREVPRGSPALGTRHARPLRRDEPAGDRAPLPRTDGRLDAHGPAARVERRARRDPGALGRLRGSAVDPHELVRRGARAAVGARRAHRAANAADPRARGGDDGHGRSARRLVLRRDADRASSRRTPRSSSIASTSSGGAVAAIEQGFVQAEIEASAFRYQTRDRGGRARRRRRQPLRGGRGRAGGDPPGRPGERAPPARADCSVRAERDADAVAARLAEVREVAESDANLLPPMREALRARATIGEICGLLRELWGTYDAQHA